MEGCSASTKTKDALDIPTLLRRRSFRERETNALPEGTERGCVEVSGGRTVRKLFATALPWCRKTERIALPRVPNGVMGLICPGVGLKVEIKVHQHCSNIECIPCFLLSFERFIKQNKIL